MWSANYAPLSAQIALGIKGHVNQSDAPLVSSNDIFTKQARRVFNPGFALFSEIRFNSRRALQIELKLRSHKSHYQIKSNIPTVETSSIQYLRLPVLMKWIWQRKDWNFVILGGPNPGYATQLLSQQTLDFYTFQEVTSRRLSFTEEGVRRFDFALTLGISIEKQIARRFRTTLDLRYDYGMLDVMKDATSTFYNRGIALEMGILIPFPFSR